MKKTVFTAIILSEASHIFCCVLPSIFSIISLMGSFGLMIAMPGWLQAVHEVMHGYEVPMIIFSASVVALGWGLHYYAHHQHKIGAHEHTCCDHDHGAPAKAKTTHRILVAATVLLILNLLVYFVFHRHQADWEHLAADASIASEHQH